MTLSMWFANCRGVTLVSKLMAKPSRRPQWVQRKRRSEITAVGLHPMKVSEQSKVMEIPGSNGKRVA